MHKLWLPSLASLLILSPMAVLAQPSNLSDVSGVNLSDTSGTTISSYPGFSGVSGKGSSLIPELSKSIDDAFQKYQASEADLGPRHFGRAARDPVCVNPDLIKLNGLLGQANSLLNGADPGQAAQIRSSFPTW